MILLNAFSFLASLASIASLLLYVLNVWGPLPALATVVLSLFGTILALRSSIMQSPVYCTGTTIRLRLCDRGCHRATFTKTQSFRPLWKHITRFDETIDFDGRIERFSAQLADAHSSFREVERHPGRVRYAQEFSSSLIPMRTYTRIVTYDYVDSYCRDDEDYSVTVSYPGVQLLVEILFPEERKPTQIAAFRVVGGIRTLIQELRLESSEIPGTMAARLRFARAVVGQTYRFEWIW